MPSRKYNSNPDIAKRSFGLTKEHYVAWSNHILGLLAVAAIVGPQVGRYDDVDTVIVVPHDTQPVPESIRYK